MESHENQIDNYKSILEGTPETDLYDLVQAFIEADYSQDTILSAYTEFQAAFTRMSQKASARDDLNKPSDRKKYQGLLNKEIEEQAKTRNQLNQLTVLSDAIAKIHPALEENNAKKNQLISLQKILDSFSSTEETDPSQLGILTQKLAQEQKRKDADQSRIRNYHQQKVQLEQVITRLSTGLEMLTKNEKQAKLKFKEFEIRLQEHQQELGIAQKQQKQQQDLCDTIQYWSGSFFPEKTLTKKVSLKSSYSLHSLAFLEIFELGVLVRFERFEIK